MRLLLSLFALVLISSCGSQDSETQTSANQASAETFKWKLVTSWPKNYPGLGSAPENFAKLVDTMSNGRLQIKVFGAGQLVCLGSIRCGFSGHRRNGSQCRILLDR